MINVNEKPYSCGKGGDDTQGMQAAIAEAEASGQRSVLVPGHCRISAPLRIHGLGFMLAGHGPHVSTINALGNFDALLSFESGSMYATASGLALLTSGTTTRCAQVQKDAAVIRFSGMYFAGDMDGDLVYSNGQNVDFDKSTWQVSSPQTWGVNFDCFNQNPGINDCRFGGIGQGLRVTNKLTPGMNRVEGLKLSHTYFITTGAVNVELGNSFLTTINGCVLDQASGRALYIGAGAENVVMKGGYLGSSQPSDAVNLHIAADAGAGHSISGNVFAWAGYGLFADATPLSRVVGLSIEGNIFNSVKNPLILDSVGKCVLRGNIDTGQPVNGSWNSKGTHPAGGDYKFSNNCWGPGFSALVHKGSKYTFDNDTRG